MHTFEYTLDLLRTVIHSMPAVFPRDRHEQMDKQLDAFLNDSNAKKEDIEATIVAFGKEIWPYYEAYEQFYRTHGEAREREAMRLQLGDRVRGIFDQFVSEGGKIEDVRGGARLETVFDEDAKVEIVNAELEAHDAVHDEMEKLIAGEMAAEFSQQLNDHQKKLIAYEEKIAELRLLASRDPRSAPEILDKAKTYEQGFAYVERLPALEDIKKEIQYYIDVMGIE